MLSDASFVVLESWPIVSSTPHYVSSLAVLTLSFVVPGSSPRHAKAFVSCTLAFAVDHSAIHGPLCPPNIPHWWRPLPRSLRMGILPLTSPPTPWQPPSSSSPFQPLTCYGYLPSRDLSFLTPKIRGCPDLLPNHNIPTRHTVHLTIPVIVAHHSSRRRPSFLNYTTHNITK